MSILVKDLMAQYKIASEEQLDHLLHGLDGFDAETIGSTLHQMRRRKILRSERARTCMDERLRSYFFESSASKGHMGTVPYGNLLPNLSLKNKPQSVFGLYVNAGRVRNVQTLEALQALVSLDNAMTTELNTFVGRVKELGATKFGNYIERALDAAHIYEPTSIIEYRYHKYSLEHYMFAIEAEAWSRLFSNSSASEQLASQDLRSYIVEEFPYVLFDRTDLLEPGNLFDRDFVTGVNKELACIYDILSISSDPEERLTLFDAAMAATSRASPPDEWSLPNDFSI